MIDITTELLQAWPLPQPEPGSDKEGHGRLVIVGGSAQVPGGVILAAFAALRAGVGKVQVAVPASIAPLVGVTLLEGRVFAMPETEGGMSFEAADAILERARQGDALLIGPGIVDNEATVELLDRLLPQIDGLPMILDAAALTALRRIDRSKSRLGEHIIITPHTGEIATLLGWQKETISEDPARALQRAAEEYHVTVVLKGAETLISQQTNALYRHRNGVVGLGIGGSGDVLAGIMGALLARGASPDQAAAWAVALHARAGERLSQRIAPLGFLARELLPEIPGLMADLNHGQ